jgi:phage terminase large subunit
MSAKKQQAVIRLPDFDPRPYQLDFLRAMDEGKKRAVLVWHRRAGKEIVCWNYMVRQAYWDRVGTYVYFFPTSRLGKRIIWDGANKDGRRFLDYVPKQLIKGTPNSVEMKIELINGSVIQIIGTDQIINVGINPVGCVFSEYSLQDPKVWQFVRPIMRENEGWVIFNGTPRGKNHFYDMLTMAKTNPDWYASHLSIKDTNVLSEEDMNKERLEGMSEHLIQQEYYCSFDQGIEGSYYGRLLDAAFRDNRIGIVPYDSSAAVNTYWDLGFGDSTAIIFAQLIGQEIHIIDYYENHGEGLSHYAKVLQEKGYVYGNHYGPHDIEAGQLSIGKSLKSYAAELGLRFLVVPKTEIEFGIECGRTLFNRVWIDEHKCRSLIKALENYHRKFNEKLNCYSNVPVHDWSSHAADAWRYLGVSLKSMGGRGSRLSPEKIKEMRRKYGGL